MKIFKILLYPVSVIYGFFVSIYHFLYDSGILQAKIVNVPTINVGNLSMGGSGKTPHVEYLFRLLGRNFKVASVSRGYGRTSSGLKFVDENNGDAAVFGDEAIMLKRKFPTKTICVSENRCSGIEAILKQESDMQVIVLDDAFQHRKLKAGLNILLTDYSNLYINDVMFPTGYLREPSGGATRADIIIVSKTPRIFSPLERRVFKLKLKLKPYQQVFFSFMEYGNLIPVYSNSLSKMLRKEDYLNSQLNVLLLTGIAKSRNLYFYIRDQVGKVKHMNYPDHHRFTVTECQKIADQFTQLSGDQKIILTTEKDAMRLTMPYAKEILETFPVYYIPIKVEFHENDKEQFDQLIKDYVRRNQIQR